MQNRAMPLITGITATEGRRVWLAQSPRRMAAGWFVAWFMVLAIPQSVSAQASAKITTAGHGLMVNAEWWSIPPTAGGYCPVHIEIANTGGPRTLRVVLEPQFRPGGGVEVDQTVEINPGDQVA